MERYISVIICWVLFLLPIDTLCCPEYDCQVQPLVQAYDLLSASDDKTSTKASSWTSSKSCREFSHNDSTNGIMAIDIKYIDWDIMTVVDISPQDFESWDGHHLHITDAETVRHLVSQIMALQRDSTLSFDVRGKISMVLPNDTMVYHYSKFHLYDGTQYYAMSPQLEQTLLRLTADSLNQ